MTNQALPRVSLCSLLITVLIAASSIADDQPQLGQAPSRNMVSGETGLPASFDLKSGENVKWQVPLGHSNYATPVIAQGRVFIGANNSEPSDPRHEGIRGVLLCLDESSGKFLWQLVVPKLKGDYYLDWSKSGICSSPTVEGERVYIVSNRGEVMCLDIDGQTDGNDGPFLDEGRLMAPADQDPLEVTVRDADVLWSFDMKEEVGVHHHDAAYSVILIDGPYLYLNTGNGVDRKHSGIPSPDAPSLIVLDKATGRLVAQDKERIGPRIFHCTWSAPSLGVVNGRKLVVFGGGDGVCYAFKALDGSPPISSVQPLELAWRFDCDPTSPKENVHDYMKNRQVSPSNIWSAPVFLDGRVYVTVGGDFFWGKQEAWLKCIDATQTGDITETGQIWSSDLADHCTTTPSLYQGMIFVADQGNTLRCIDQETGENLWTHRVRGDVWSSTLCADGKVYYASWRNEGGEMYVFEAAREKRLLAQIDLGSRTYSAPVAANGVLYVATMESLYAIAKEGDAE